VEGTERVVWKLKLIPVTKISCVGRYEARLMQ
jgi:hypothetical protein